MGAKLAQQRNDDEVNRSVLGLAQLEQAGDSAPTTVDTVSGSQMLEDDPLDRRDLEVVVAHVSIDPWRISDSMG